MLLLLLSTGSSQVWSAGSCTVFTTATPFIDFGLYTSGQSSDVLRIGMLNLTCTAATTFNVSANQGLNQDAGFPFHPRYMKKTTGTQKAAYNLYLAPPLPYTGNIRTETGIFGDGTISGTQRYTPLLNFATTCPSSIVGLVLPGSTGTCSIPIWGRVYGGQVLSGGYYTDDVVITVNF